MAGSLRVVSVKAPAFMGLNTQESDVSLTEGYATIANNCIIDRYGRLGSRRGWSPITTSPATLTSTETIGGIFEYVEVDGNAIFLTQGGNKLFTGLNVLTPKTVRNTLDTADQSYTITANNWQIVSNALGAGATGGVEAYLAQANHPMLCFSTATTANKVYRRLGDVGSVPTGYATTNYDPNTVLAAYGRVWTANTTSNKLTVYYSRLLAGHHFSGVGSGLIDVSSVVGNNDEIVAISAYNGFLVIFCRNNIVVYANADDPTQLTLSDTIQGVGCIARDSIQKCGEDLVFLSRSGVRSLRRTIQEKSMPMRELSINIRDDLIEMIQGQNVNDIKSIYYPRDAFYILTIPTLQRIIYFDMRGLLDNGGARTTIWTGLTFSTLATARDNNLYLGVMGGVAIYRGYLDNTSSYRMSYYTTNTDYGVANTIKSLKKLKLTAIASDTQNYIFKYAYDYTDDFTSRTAQRISSLGLAEYNIAEYNIGEYTGGLFTTQVSIQASGHGDVSKLGIETPVNGSPISIQRMDVYFKLGRLI